MPEGSLAETGLPDGAGHRALLSLGANIGDRQETIARALEMIAATPGISLIRASAFYATDPVGYLEQPEFINSAAVIGTALAPAELLERLREIELKLGRVRRQKWHEREIDIDIILIDDLVIGTEQLTVPHPEMQHRVFVLVPLAEIAPEARHPLLGKTVREILGDLGDTAGIRMMGDTGP